MAGLALTLALAAPLLGSSGPGDTFDVPSVVNETQIVEASDPFEPRPEREPEPPVPEPIQVPADISYFFETGAVVVTPPPPPPPPPVVAPAPAGATAPASRGSVERAALAPNGQIPLDALCALSWDPSSLLRCDAAAGLEAAAGAGMPLVHLTDAYRSYDEQVAVKRVRGSFAATPGTSNHGQGLAIDIPEPARSWLHRNGAAYGWVNPAWARGYEPWHFLFEG